MPIYLPWLGIITAVFSTIADICVISKWVGFFPLYSVLVAFILVSVFVGILKTDKISLLCLLFPILVYVRACSASQYGDLSVYLGKQVELQAQLLENSNFIRTGGRAYFLAKIQPCLLLWPEQKKLTGSIRLLIFAGHRSNGGQIKAGQKLKIAGILVQSQQQTCLRSLGIVNKNTIVQLQTNIGHVSFLETKKEEEKNIILISLASKDFIDRIREKIRCLHEKFLGKKQGSLLASMVLGDKAVVLDDSIVTVFRKIGLSHIVAASGFNLTIITAITYWLMRKILRQRSFITIIVCLNVGFYAVLAGLSASIVRSAIACILVLFAHLYYRKLHKLAMLAFVFQLNIILDPLVVNDIGAQLSYTAVGGILLGIEPLSKLLSFGLNYKILKILSSSSAVILLAQTAVLPVQLYYFWRTNFLFLPANLIIDPFVSPLTIMGFAASFLGLFDIGQFTIGSLFCQILDSVASIALTVIIFIAEALSKSNLAEIRTGQPCLLSIFCYYLLFVSLLTSLNKEKFRYFFFLAFLSSVVFLFYKEELKKPLILFLPHSTIAINKHRDAMCFGSDEKQEEKILAFYAAKMWRPAQSQSFILLADKSSDKEITLNKITGLQFSLSKTNPEGKLMCFIDRSGNESFYNGKPAQISISQFKKTFSDLDIKTCCRLKTIIIKSGQ